MRRCCTPFRPSFDTEELDLEASMAAQRLAHAYSLEVRHLTFVEGEL